MEHELENRLQSASKEQLIHLLREIAVRHPVLLAEIDAMLEQPTTSSDEGENASELDNEATEDWDFSGGESDLIELRSIPRPILPSLDLEGRHQHIDGYAQRLAQGELQQSVGSDLLHFLQEAEVRTNQHDYQGALDLYALVIDKRLNEHDATLIAIFDKALDEVMPLLEALLSETSSSIVFEDSIAVSPLLTPTMRHSWLRRLFTLWLKRLELYHIEEGMPQIMLDIAWNDDTPLLRALVQEELQHIRQAGRSNIVDFSRQYRLRALEKFLHELSYL